MDEALMALCAAMLALSALRGRAGSGIDAPVQRGDIERDW